MARGKVVFNEDRCKGCELCTTVCPTKILVMSEKINKLGYHPASVSDPDKCTGCAAHARICRTVLFSVSRMANGGEYERKLLVKGNGPGEAR